MLMFPPKHIHELLINMLKWWEQIRTWIYSTPGQTHIIEQWAQSTMLSSNSDQPAYKRLKRNSLPDYTSKPATSTSFRITLTIIWTCGNVSVTSSTLITTCSTCLWRSRETSIPLHVWNWCIWSIHHNLQPLAICWCSPQSIFMSSSSTCWNGENR